MNTTEIATEGAAIGVDHSGSLSVRSGTSEGKKSSRRSSSSRRSKTRRSSTNPHKSKSKSRSPRPPSSRELATSDDDVLLSPPRKSKSKSKSPLRSPTPSTNNELATSGDGVLLSPPRKSKSKSKSPLRSPTPSTNNELATSGDDVLLSPPRKSKSKSPLRSPSPSTNNNGFQSPSASSGVYDDIRDRKERRKSGRRQSRSSGGMSPPRKSKQKSKSPVRSRSPKPNNNNNDLLSPSVSSSGVYDDIRDRKDQRRSGTRSSRARSPRSDSGHRPSSRKSSSRTPPRSSRQPGAVRMVEDNDNNDSRVVPAPPFQETNSMVVAGAVDGVVVGDKESDSRMQQMEANMTSMNETNQVLLQRMSKMQERRRKEKERRRRWLLILAALCCLLVCAALGVIFGVVLPNNVKERNEDPAPTANSTDVEPPTESPIDGGDDEGGSTISIILEDKPEEEDPDFKSLIVSHNSSIIFVEIDMYKQPVSDAWNATFHMDGKEESFDVFLKSSGIEVAKMNPIERRLEERSVVYSGDYFQRTGSLVSFSIPSIYLSSLETYQLWLYSPVSNDRVPDDGYGTLEIGDSDPNDNDGNPLPSQEPSSVPSNVPTKNPAGSSGSLPVATPAPTSAGDASRPTGSPTIFSDERPTGSPTLTSTSQPTSGSPVSVPTQGPSIAPATTTTLAPSRAPVAGTSSPTKLPTLPPTPPPTSPPTPPPTNRPTLAPAPGVTPVPTLKPSSMPTQSPSEEPSEKPTLKPSSMPTQSPSEVPSETPTSRPSAAPSKAPTQSPSNTPSNKPTLNPTSSPTSTPTQSPSVSPSQKPSTSQSVAPTPIPTCQDEGIAAELERRNYSHQGAYDWVVTTDVFNPVGDTPEDRLLRCVERYAIVAMYLDLGLGDSTDLSTPHAGCDGGSWLIPGDDHCNWSAIRRCSPEVERITIHNGCLKDQLLSGSLATDLTFLPNLRDLELHGLGLTGTIPDGYGDFDLTKFDLADNNLSGPIPDVSGMFALTSLSLHEQSLTGTLPDLSATQIGYFRVSRNDLYGPFPSFPPTAYSIRLYGNNFFGTIPDLTYMTNLQLLKIQSNDFWGSIPNCASLTALTSLDKDSEVTC